MRNKGHCRRSHGGEAVESVGIYIYFHSHLSHRILSIIKKVKS